METIPEECDLPSKCSIQDSNFMHLISSRFESTRTMFGNLSTSTLQSSINPSSYDSRVETHHLPFHSSSSEFVNFPKEDLPSKLASPKSLKKTSGPNNTFDFSHHESFSKKTSKKSCLRNLRKSSCLHNIYPLRRPRKIFLFHRPNIARIISKMILRRLTSLRKLRDTTKPYFCLHLKSPTRKLQDP